MTKNNVYFCCFCKDDEWGSFVVAPARGQAKSLFVREFNDCGEWNDIRCYKIKDVPDNIPITPQCLDTPDNPMLKMLGLKYQEIDY